MKVCMNILSRSVLLLVSVISVLLADSATKPGDRTILASFYPMYITALNVAQEVPGVEVVSLTKQQTGCLHDYQLTPQDIKTISTAWAFVVNGGGMEAFLDKVVKQYPKLNIIDASKGITLINGEGGEGDNPHVWVSVSGAIAQVKNVVDGLAAIDTANAVRYRANGDAYVARLETLRTKMHEGLANISSHDIITFHEAFPYFAKEFNLHIVAVIEREPGSEPSAGELARTVKIIKQKKVKALFAEPQYPAKAAQTIAKETGLNVYILDPAATGPASSDAYIRIMESNLKVLQEALK
jgi:zinc transport system substrate-binding protein